MKLVISLLLFSFVTTAIYGQLNKSTWLVGGAGSFYSYNENYNSPQTNFTAEYSNISINASVGYFIIDKLNVGLRPTFAFLKGEVDNGGKTHSYQLAAGPYCRYYFLDPEKPFNLLADVSYQFGTNRYLGALHQKGRFNTFSIRGGTEVFFNSAVGIEILLGYSENLTSIDDNTVGAFKSKKRGLQASIGFQFHLEKD